VVAVAVTITITEITVLLVFLLLLKTANDLLERGLTQVIRFHSLVLFVLLEAGFDLVPGICQTHRGLQTLNPRAKCINCAALVSICCMFLLLITADGLLLNALEEKTQDIGINLRSASIRKHDLGEFLKRSLGSNLVVFVLKAYEYLKNNFNFG
jgi:hypothetical protein